MTGFSFLERNCTRIDILCMQKLPMAWAPDNSLCECGGGLPNGTSPLGGLLCIFCCLWLLTGCERSKRPTSEAVGRPIPSADGSPLVSIGQVTTVDLKAQWAVMHFFVTNGVSCGIDGSVVYSLMIHRDDVERAQAILRTNWPPKAVFRSVWETR
jgi:hypothetical protein